jgi:CRISPR-associated protein Cmr4
MYHKAYGIIETLAPLHVGASAGEETGNLNLIFRDQFTQTGIIPGSSIRGRFRADMRHQEPGTEQRWYGHEAVKQAERTEENEGTTEALVKFEYASIIWLPVFCPGQPIVWVTCPLLLKRYQRIAQVDAKLPVPYTASTNLKTRQGNGAHQVLFFNLGFLEIKQPADLKPWVPAEVALNSDHLVIVDDRDMAMIHDMALYRQSRVRLADDEKKVDGGGFFNVEALPEGTVMIFPIALREKGWQPFADKAGNASNAQELYLGGLESIGFGRCQVILLGDY